MAPEPQSDAGSVTPERPSTPQRPRRGRRGGRGHRGRGRGAALAAAPPPTATPAELPEPGQPVETPSPAARETPPPPPRRDFQPASPAAVTDAIEQVNHIIETLRATLDDMQEVLETVELAERQKNADEHEIETLRRGLRQFHRPRDEGGHSARR